MNMNSEINMNPWIWIMGIFMNPWIWYLSNLWTHEFHKWKIHEPMNMKSNNAMNSWIWISYSVWTREYEYVHVTLWTFKSSFSSWKFMNHAMNSMNCNAWFFWLISKVVKVLQIFCRVIGKSKLRNSKYRGIAIPLISVKSPRHYRILRRSDQTQNKTLNYFICDCYATENSKRWNW